MASSALCCFLVRLRHKQLAERRGKVPRTHRTVGFAVPRVTAQAVEDAPRQSNGVAPCPRRRCARTTPRAHRVNEIMQFVGELIAGVAIHFQRLQVATEEFRFEGRKRRRIQAAQVPGRLRQRETSLRKSTPAKPSGPQMLMRRAGVG